MGMAVQCLTACIEFFSGEFAHVLGAAVLGNEHGNDVGCKVLHTYGCEKLLDSIVIHVFIILVLELCEEVAISTRRFLHYHLLCDSFRISLFKPRVHSIVLVPNTCNQI